MSEKENSYGQILKATSLFGGVQVFNILVGAIRSKAIALIVGPTGFGVLGLFNSTLRIIEDLTKVGLDTSAVKEISERYHDSDSSKMQETIAILEKVIWITAAIGALLTICFSKAISLWTFGSDDYQFSFVWLSIAVIFTQFTKGKIAVLQGTRQLKTLASANLVASTVSLIGSLPLYYYFQLEGIVPALIFTAIVTFVVFKLANRVNTLQSINFTRQDLYQKSKPMLKLGSTMSFMSLFGALIAYLILVYIRRQDGVAAAGFYSAGFLIVNSYVGMIFNAMSTDYFPRLAAVNKDNSKMTLAVNRQADIAMLLITPIIIVFQAFASLIIAILYSGEFDVILGLVTFGVLGVFFKSVSFSMGYVIIAKGHSKVFLTTSIFFNLLMLLICVYSYDYNGLTGIGFGLMVYYFIHLVVIKIITRQLYQIKFDKNFYSTFAVCALFCLASYGVTLLETMYLRYSTMGVLIIGSMSYSIWQFNKKMDLMQFFRSLIKKD
jgi:O-antigen/teichoic acid export membrane protein